jgi:hypothetical protein
LTSARARTISALRLPGMVSLCESVPGCVRPVVCVDLFAKPELDRIAVYHDAELVNAFDVCFERLLAVVHLSLR